VLSYRRDVRRHSFYSSKKDRNNKKLWHQPDKPKFLAALRRFGNWPDSKKISRPFLEGLLIKAKKDPDFDPVRNHVASLPPFPNDSVVSTSHDLDPKWFKANWPEDQKTQKPKTIPITNGKRVKQLTFRDLQHDQLFYDFRNQLVHEMRSLHREADIPPHAEPFYHRLCDMTVRPYRESWQLKHPPKFVENLALSILQGLADDFRRRQSDPASNLWTKQHWTATLDSVRSPGRRWR